MQSFNRTIVVKGTGKYSAAPDLIVLKIKLEAFKQHYFQTMEYAAELLEALRFAIQSAGHDEKALKTTRFNIDTKFERYKKLDEWQERFIGYISEHSLSLEFDFDMEKLGATLEAISKCKAKPKLNIKFSIKDPGAVSEQLLQNAIENAKLKADILAKSAGVKLGAIQRIDYNWGELNIYSETDYTLREECRDYISSVSMDITPKDIDMSDTVTVVWEIDS